jgi:hypothetical protein
VHFLQFSQIIHKIMPHKHIIYFIVLNYYSLTTIYSMSAELVEISKEILFGIKHIDESIFVHFQLSLNMKLSSATYI